MNLIILDKDFNQLTFLAPTNIQWNRKYYEVGTFIIQMLAEDYQSNFKYVYTSERPEVGIIEKVSYLGSDELIQIEGHFIEQILNDKITWPTFYGNGEITSVVNQMVNQYKEDIPLLEVGTLALGDSIKFQSTGEELGLKIADVLKQQEMAYRISYNFEQNKLLFKVYKGQERTTDHNDGTIVTFATTYGNIYNLAADVDESNYKNYAVVGGQGEGKDRITEIVDLSNGGYKKKVFINASQISQQEGSSLEEYKAELRNEGLQNLLDYQSIKNVEFDALASDYEYMNDYDIGTKCDIIIDEIQLSMEARIIAIYEVFKENEHTISLEFGDKLLTNYEKARLSK